ncbi:MliC family protein [Mycobacterium stomatepiae]|uniref:Lipoprotein LprI n=1 Tax=Mycobacterium stomatepiae TaxID=470076 RepID=A0A7I7Q3J5_9MYCO|nr:MliC family protein [Mycobacterium stomatepiae]MCV7165068.1 MliC family protein [Mycobacterium stomatepiae]BBY20950.1 lipoprotein LprI [Mycobacterium stomatepiae]
MRPIAVIAAVLVVLVGACTSATNNNAAPSSPPSHPASGSPSAAPTSGSPPPIPAAVDCTKPANAAQQPICTDSHLFDLERQLGDAYRRALARPGTDQSAVAAAQTSWASGRDDCARNADVHTCVLQAYQTRLVQLAIADPATAAPPVVTYRCPATSGPLTAQFYNQFDPQTAVLDWKGTQLILFILPSGSGARYGRQGSEYWEHQGQVTLDFNGTKFVCSTS